MTTNNNLIQTKEELDSFISQNWNVINQYIDEKMSKLTVPFYSSIDIRESRTKYAPVDNNIYPAGFNNLCLLDLDASAKAIKEALKSFGDNVQKVGIIPESHTKNTFYLDHLAMLGKAVRDAGFDVVFLGLDQNLFNSSEQTELNLVSHSGFDVSLYRTNVLDGRFQVLGNELESVDVAILNNDQSTPLDVNWSELKTPVIPTPKIGWFRRQKPTHFQFYNQVVQEFCQHFNIDSNLIQAKFKSVPDVDFMNKDGLEKLSAAVDELLGELPAESHVFVKAGQGTYGMGISVVQSGKEIIEMNRKMRNKMDIGKNKIKFTTALTQESVETILKYDEMPAEVTIYQINGKSVGGFMRANSEKDSHSNLNSRGMVFKKFCISEIRQNQDHKAKEATYSIIARLSTLASAYEIEEVIKE